MRAYERFRVDTAVNLTTQYWTVVRTARDLPAGHVVTRDDLVVLRPAPRDAFAAHEVDAVVGRTLGFQRILSAQFDLRRTSGAVAVAILARGIEIDGVVAVLHHRHA